MAAIIDLSGKKFGRLTALEICGRTHRGQCIWRCQCDCGNKKDVVSNSLQTGNTKSCGCIHKSKLSERNKSFAIDYKKTRLYRIWGRMIYRCTNTASSDYSRYGGKGVKVCEEWMSFSNFQEWANSNGYSDNLSIDRIDFDGSYEPKNCRWATSKLQANNKSSNNLITYNGLTKSLAEWAEEYNTDSSKIRYRLRRNWDINKVFSNL